MFISQPLKHFYITDYETNFFNKCVYNIILRRIRFSQAEAMVQSHTVYLPVLKCQLAVTISV